MAISKPTKPYSFTNGTGQTADATEVNEDFDILYAKIDELIDALNNAAGSKTALANRLAVSMNADGSMKAAITAGGEWVNIAATPLYVSASSFTCVGDHTDIYLPYRRIKATLAASTVYSEVVTSTYSAGTGKTTVTILSSVLTDPLTSIEHGVISPQSSGTSGLPTTKVGVLNVKVMNIGDWNMVSTQSKVVAHGLDWTKIRDISVLVVPDTGTTVVPITFNIGTESGSASYDGTNVNLARTALQYFDSVNFDATSFNRGYITLWYVD